MKFTIHIFRYFLSYLLSSSKTQIVASFYYNSIFTKLVYFSYNLSHKLRSPLGENLSAQNNVITFVSMKEETRQREREKERRVEIRPEKSSSEYIRRPSVVDNPTWPDSGVVALDHAEDEDGNEREREERNRDQELGPRVDDQGWIDPWPSYRVLQLTRCQLSFSLLLSYSSVLGSLPRSPGIYILSWSKSYIGRSFVDSLHYNRDDDGNDNDSLPPTVPGRP